ncbi:MAG: hypothetical protein U0797_23460 [Gemmataceae bacterium]
MLLGSGEYGLVCAFDDEAKCCGATAWWRVGSLAVAGDGSRAVLACFTGSLYCFAAMSPKRTAARRRGGPVAAGGGGLPRRHPADDRPGERAARGPDGDVQACCCCRLALWPGSRCSRPLRTVAVLSDGTLAGSRTRAVG